MKWNSNLPFEASVYRDGGLIEIPSRNQGGKPGLMQVTTTSNEIPFCTKSEYLSQKLKCKDLGYDQKSIN